MFVRLATLLPVAAAWDTHGYPWYDQFPAEEYFQMPNGKKHQLPLRLHSRELVLTGTANLESVKESFESEGEYYTPLSVGGKAVVELWMNNFTDTDCGNDDTKNPYLETWISTWVTPKDSPHEIEYASDFSLMIQDPKALIWIHRVILGDAPGIDTATNDPALGALLGGHGVWGFPKHSTKAKIETHYEGEDRVHFQAQHIKTVSGKKTFVDAVVANVKLPEKTEGVMVIPVDARTGPDTVIGGPLWNVQQTRFGQAFNTTMNIAPWDSKVDRLEIGHDDYFSTVLRAWNFEPKLKMHTDDFQIAAFKPINWVSKGSPSKTGSKQEL